MLAAIAGTVTLLCDAYTELLWFREVGHEGAYLETLKWKLLGHAVPGLGTAAFLLANFAAVERVMALHRPRHPWRQLTYPLVAIAAGVLAGRGDGGWRLLVLWHGRSDFGVQDPIFHRDVGFFVFSLPLQQAVARWLLFTLAMAGAATLAAYLLTGGLRTARPYVAAPGARGHLLVLVALALAVTAWRCRLDQYALALPHDGSAVPGAGYTDVHVRLPALRLLELLTVGATVLALYAAVRRVPRRVLAAVGALAVLVLFGPEVVARTVEHYSVEPQVLPRERAYVSASIAATRDAYALDAVEVRDVAGDGQISGGELADNRGALDNIPLWDSGVLRLALDDQQSIGRYYSFPRLTVDRYRVGDEQRVVTLAARELDLRALGPGARSWTNDRFAYTHGFGAVAVTDPQAEADGQPHFGSGFVGPVSLGLRQPRIYFTQRRGAHPPYLVLDSHRGEIDAPVPGSSEPSYHYDGPGGIPLSNLLRRAAFAARFGDLKLLLSQTATYRSRIVLHRNALDRLRELAPFLRWEQHAQTAVIGGRLQFLYHGYTSSSHYPYSAPVRFHGAEVNYLRASAHAAVDAFSGQVSIYADETDPIMRAWRAAYPDLLQPAERMPASMREHLRYPRGLFAAQADVYSTYHADDATGFWNGADAWQRPLQIAGPIEDAGELRFPDPEARIDPDERDELDGWVMRPRYLLTRLPGDEGERFALVLPFTPRGRQNVVSYLAGSIDEAGRPQLVSLSFPRDRLAVGPAQATRRILASESVSRRLDLINRESRDLGRAALSRTVLGTPRMLPVGDALVHVQPAYVTASGGGVPRLQLVTAYAHGGVGFGPDVRTAVRRAVRDR